MPAFKAHRNSDGPALTGPEYEEERTRSFKRGPASEARA